MDTENKNYISSKIPKRIQPRESGAGQVREKPAPVPLPSLSDNAFYEIEYDSGPVPGVGRFVRCAQKIEEPEKDEIRGVFREMRSIAGSNQPAYGSNPFFDRPIHRFNSAVFYKQALFMKDFTDDYDKSTPFARYFPSYQLMGYEQLRTYFTWRTAVRCGKVADISVSYAFLYIYELLNGIGVNDPDDGLCRLLFFWKAFRDYNQTIDKYVLQWLKDYHIYYELPHTFREFVVENDLSGYYPGSADPDDSFSRFCPVSGYDIRKSAFYTEERASLVRDCFNFTVRRLRTVFMQNGMSFDEAVFQPFRKPVLWTPFRDALFYPWSKQSDRKVNISENEFYICKNNEWTYSSFMMSESARTFVGYISKRMEVSLRRITGYKYKLSANISDVTHESVIKLRNAGVPLDSVIDRAVSDYYREATKIVVKVDNEALSRIREESLLTQGKLIVPEVTETISPRPVAPEVSEPLVPSHEEVQGSEKALWDELENKLTDIEIKALAAIYYEKATLEQFAASCGIMPEILADGINEKAMDCVGDNILDDEFILYEEYKEQVKGLVESI